MKTIMTFIVVCMLSSNLAKAQQDYRLWFTRNGVDVYSAIKTSTYAKWYVLKIVNNNNYNVDVSFKFTWKQDGIEVKEHATQLTTVRADQTREGDMSGLYFYPPEGYNIYNLQITLKNLTIKRTE